MDSLTRQIFAEAESAEEIPGIIKEAGKAVGSITVELHSLKPSEIYMFEVTVDEKSINIDKKIEEHKRTKSGGFIMFLTGGYDYAFIHNRKRF